MVVNILFFYLFFFLSWHSQRIENIPFGMVFRGIRMFIDWKIDFYLLYIELFGHRMRCPSFKVVSLERYCRCDENHVKRCEIIYCIESRTIFLKRRIDQKKKGKWKQKSSISSGNEIKYTIVTLFRFVRKICAIFLILFIIPSSG